MAFKIQVLESVGGAKYVMKTASSLIENKDDPKQQSRGGNRRKNKA
jgi:hypothetical protein